jgi:alkaline phosphatase D
MKNLLLLSSLLVALFSQAQPHLAADRSDLSGALAPFYHGVASGDPLTDRVILWTRITTENNTETVEWQVATDTLFTILVASGSTTTDSSKDFTVKVDATGLQANTWYYYRFKNGSDFSMIGRTRTAPSTSVNNLRFAVVACSNYQDGFFNAYRDIATKNDVDMVIHLGDYYYEYGPDDFSPGVDSSRLTEPYSEILTLSDYRIRHSVYKLDPDLRFVHQQYPFIAVWDDHETANNSWTDGAENHTPGTEGVWAEREDAGKKAYFEWMPIRDNYNSFDTIHRTIPLGGLADLIMIDTRLEGRQEQIGTTGAAVTDTNRTLLGPNQLSWFKQQLSSSTAQWKIIGNQVMVSPLRALGQFLNDDQWDGYPAERKKILTHIEDNNIDNVVILTGDIHTSWANDIPVDVANYTSSTGAGSVAVEYVCTSVTSGSFITFAVPVSLIQSFNPNIKYADLSKRGYLLLDVTPQRVQGDWIYVNTISNKNFTTTVGASWCDVKDENHLTSCGSALTPRNNLPPLAPVITSANKSISDPVVMLACFPNPFLNELKLQYYLPNAEQVSITLRDVSGKVVFSNTQRYSASGSYFETVALPSLAKGSYYLTLSNGKSQTTRQLVKVK